jgi:hypothetical protein
MTLPNLVIQDLNRALGDDRRLHRRYPIELDCECKLQGTKWVGRGTTLNISSGGVALETDQGLSIHSRVEVSIHWPYMLDDRCPLRLRIIGRVVRIDGKSSAVRTEHYEFRTTGRGSGAIIQCPLVRVRRKKLPERHSVSLFLGSLDAEDVLARAM